MRALTKYLKYFMILLSVFMIIFSIIMGAENYGSGLSSAIQNSPNSVPWVILLIISILLFKNAKIGSILLIIYGVLLVYFFNFSGPNFWWVVFFGTLIIPIIGLLILLEQRITKSK